MLTRRALLSGVGGVAAASLLASSGRADYPDRLIKIIVPGSPGGPTDVMARLISQRLQQSLGQSVVVENRAGGGGSVAAKAVASAEPDGYTLLFCNTSIMTTIPAVAKRPDYDPVKNFAPIAKVSQSEQLLVLHPSVPPNSIAEFIAYCKASPGKLNCAATGYGGLPHLVAESFKAKTGVDYAIIQYKGGGNSLTAVLGHQVDLTFETTTILLPHIREGKLKGLAVTSAARNAECASDPFQPGRNISGFRTGPLGMGHVVLHMKSIEDVMPFYRDVLEFKLSDYFTRPFQCFFFHVNPRHHSIAFAEVGRDAVHHMMVELYSLDDMGQGYDIAQMDPDKIAVTLGRHAGDYVTSFYTHNPSGFQTEYGWGAQSIDDATWTPFERTCGPSFWGHDRYWLPPDKQQEARELRMQAARDGVRKPVQVIEGNYTLNPGVCPWWDAVTQKQKSA